MKKFLFLLITFALIDLCNAQNIKVLSVNEGVLFMENSNSVLFYQTAPKSMYGEYERCNYIHPLYALDGKVITQDFPEDHPHQRGIFWAWHQLYIGDKRIGDGWEIEDISWKIDTVYTNNDERGSKSVSSTVFWKSSLWLDEKGNQKPMIKEETNITVYPASKNYRVVDIKISLLALEPDMRIGGSENEKGYGGFSARMLLSDDTKFTGSAGEVIPENLPVKAGQWVDISGSIGKDSSTTGITIMCHPDNSGDSSHWILRRKKSMQNAVYPYPGATAVPISQTEPTVLRYRLVVHEGNSSALDIKSIFNEYVK